MLLTSALAHAELRVPGYTAYLSPNPDGAQVSERSGVTGWNDPALQVLWFGELRAIGPLTCAVALRLPAGATSKLRLTVQRQMEASGAVAGSAVAQASTTQVTGTDGQSVTARFGPYAIPVAGYYRFALESLNERVQPAGDVEALVLDGAAAQAAHFNLKERRNAASVHLFYPLPKGTKAAAFYCEVTAVEDPIYTYYMACGWHRGYFGMQVNGPHERHIIFSVWDSGNEGVNRTKVADADRVKLMAKGENVFAGDFGNEGTGGHSHLNYMWKTGETQRFIVTAQPVDATHTIYSGFYFHPDQKKWTLISSWRAPKEGGYMRGLYSFSENFGGSNGYLRRKARFGNQWIRTADGQWLELTTASFSYDGTGKTDRLDRFMGVEDGAFFLSNGGFSAGSTPFGEKFTRPATGRPPQVDLPPLPTGP